jgi:hypothetical protein
LRTSGLVWMFSSTGTTGRAGLATLAIGVPPDHAQIGTAAALLLHPGLAPLGAEHHQSFTLTLVGRIGVDVLMGLALGVTPATMVEMLPTEVRCSGVAIGYNLYLRCSAARRR